MDNTNTTNTSMPGQPVGGDTMPTPSGDAGIGGGAPTPTPTEPGMGSGMPEPTVQTPSTGETGGTPTPPIGGDTGNVVPTPSEDTNIGGGAAPATPPILVSSDG